MSAKPRGLALACWPVAAAIGALSSIQLPVALVLGAIPLLAVTLALPTWLPALVAGMGLAPLFGPHYVVVALLVVAAAAGGLVGRRYPGRSSTSLSIVALVGFLALSLGWTDAPLKPALIALSPSLTLLLGCVRWPLGKRTMLLAFVAAGALHAAFTLFEFAALGAAVRVTEKGPFGLPTLVVGGVAAASLAITERPSRRRMLAVSAVIAAAILATQTRGMAIGYLVGVVSFPAITALRTLSPTQRQGIQRRGRAALMAAVLLIGSLGIISAVVESSGGRFSLSSIGSGFTGRIGEASSGVAQIRSSPLIGHGVGHNFDNPIVGTQRDVNYVHNSLIYFGIATGLLGIGLFAAFLLQAGRRSLANDETPYGAAMVAVLIGVIVYSLTSALQRTLHFNLFLAAIAGTADSRPVEGVAAETTPIAATAGEA